MRVKRRKEGIKEADNKKDRIIGIVEKDKNTEFKKNNIMIVIKKTTAIVVMIKIMITKLIITITAT